MPEQQQRERPQQEQAPWTPRNAGPFEGPRAPAIDKPDTTSLIKRMKTVDSNQSKKYRQRIGE
jgi:hypothetical protein